jgi:hypothetical protein
MHPLKTFVCILLAYSLVSGASAAPVVEKYDDGKPKKKFSLDSQGRKDGPYTEYYPSGKVKVKATYKAGKLEGTYSENTPDGQKSLTALYRAGKLHGTLTQYVKGKTVLTQPFQNGKLVHPKSLEEIRTTLNDVLAAPAEKPAGALAAERAAALRRLQAYRYLVDLPYDNLRLDDDLNEAAQAAAKICEKLRRLDHAPKNPGWPKEEFDLAFKGASHSNLAFGDRMTLPGAMTEWMDDSDPVNVDRLGHRRWCMNPVMKKVGFGRAGIYMAMWAFDKSQPKVPDYRFVSYPARGLMPLEYFRSVSAWHVSLNPKKFRKPGKSLEPKIYNVGPLLNKLGEPLKLNYQNVETNFFGIPYCIIFRPEKSAVAPGKRYLVEIEGLRNSKGGPAVVRYLVEFARLTTAAR